jgi:RNA recognition motif-containing protein
MQSPSDDGLIVTAYDEAPSQPVPKEKTWAIFVGDLSRDVDADKLKAAFSAYPSIYDAKVVMDPKTGNSRGYGFVSFLEKSEAAAAIEQMDGVLKVGKVHSREPPSRCMLIKRIADTTFLWTAYGSRLVGPQERACRHEPRGHQAQHQRLHRRAAANDRRSLQPVAVPQHDRL